MHPILRPCLIASLAACLVASAPPAPSPWSTTVRRTMGGEVLESCTTWQLLFKSGTEGVSGTTHPQVKAWMDMGDLTTRWVDEKAFDPFLKRRGLDAATTWLLVDPENRLVLSGAGLPSAEAVAQAISMSLVKSPREVLKAFLKLHPERADLWRQALHVRYQKLVAVVESHRAVEGESPEVALTRLQEHPAWAEVAWALKGLREVPEWPLAFRGDGSHSLHRASMLSAPPTYLSEVRVLRDELVTALGEDPSEDSLQALWCNLAQALPSPRVQDFLGMLLPLPGAQADRGPLGGLVMLLEGRQDWEGLLRLTDAIGDRVVSQTGLTPPQWKKARGIHVDWVGTTRLRALLHLGREAEGARWIENCHHWAGSEWEGRKWVDHLGKLPASWLPLLDQPPGPDPVAPAPAPLPVSVRLRVLDDPALLRRLKVQRRELPLALWPAGAFEVEPATPEELQRWKKDAPGLAWVLVQEGRELARGTAAPEVDALAQILDGARPAPLRDLEAFLRQNPQRMDGWRRKQELLRARMPHDRLELALCETAERTGLPLKPSKDWRPRPEVWAPVARRVLPRLLERLERFPNALQHWEAVLDWMDVHPAPPALGPRILAMGQLPLPDHVGALPGYLLAGGLNAMARHGRHQDVATVVEGVMDDLRREIRRGGDTDPTLKRILILGAEAQEALGRSAQAKAWREEAAQVKGVDREGR